VCLLRAVGTLQASTLHEAPSTDGAEGSLLLRDLLLSVSGLCLRMASAAPGDLASQQRVSCLVCTHSMRSTNLCAAPLTCAE